MKIIAGQIIRFIKKNIKQLIYIIVICSISLGVLIGINSAVKTLETTQNEYFSTFKYNKRITISETNKKYSSDIEMRNSFQFKNNNKIIITNIVSDMNDYVTTVDGSKLDQNGVALDYLYANKNNLKIGDSILIVHKNKEKYYPITSLVYAAEYTNFLPMNSQVVPDHENNGYVYLNEKVWEQENPIMYNEILLSSDQEIESIPSEYIQLATISFTDDISYQTVEAKKAQISSIEYLFPILLFFLAILVTFTTLKRIIQSEKTNILTLYSFGFSKKYYLKIILISFFIATIFIILLGLILGIIIPVVLMQTMKSLFAFPKYIYTISGDKAIIGIIIIYLLIAITTIIELKNVYNLNLVKALKGETTVKNNNKKFFINKPKIYFSIKIFARDLFNNPAKYFISIIGVALGAALMISALGLNDTLNNIKTSTYENTYKYEYKNYYSPSKNLVKQENEELFFETKAVVSKNNNTFNAPVLALETNTKYVNLIDENNTPININANGIIISKKLAEINNINLNDEISLNMNGYIITDKVVGFAKTVVGQSIFINLNQMNNFKNGIFSNKEISSINNSEHLQVISKKEEINDFDIFMKSMRSIVLLIIIVSTTVLLTILITFGLLSFSNKKRIIEILRLLSFKKIKAFSVIFFEYLLIGIIGLIISIPLGVYLHKVIFSKGWGNHLDVTLYLNDSSIYIVIIFTIIVIITSILSILRIDKKINLISTSKGQE